MKYKMIITREIIINFYKFPWKLYSFNTLILFNNRIIKRSSCFKLNSLQLHGSYKINFNYYRN